MTTSIATACVMSGALGGIADHTLTQPCVTCAKTLINAGVRRIVYRDAYPDELAQQILAEACVELVEWQPAGEREG